MNVRNLFALLAVWFAVTAHAAPRNVATDPAYRQTLERMRKEVESFRRRTRDPWLGEASVFH